MRAIEDKLHPTAELPEERQAGDDGARAQNRVAALHGSRSGDWAVLDIDASVAVAASQTPLAAFKAHRLVKQPAPPASERRVLVLG